MINRSLRALHPAARSQIWEELSPSLRAKRSNLLKIRMSFGDCFAALAMTLNIELISA
jgi:hypothetical protein